MWVSVECIELSHRYLLPAGHLLAEPAESPGTKSSLPFYIQPQTDRPSLSEHLPLVQTTSLTRKPLCLSDVQLSTCILICNKLKTKLTLRQYLSVTCYFESYHVCHRPHFVLFCFCLKHTELKRKKNKTEQRLQICLLVIASIDLFLNTLCF